MNFNYPAALPITPLRRQIQDALQQNQVVIVAGDTGSGKTTQLPKMCLEIMPASKGIIGCTQPRRIAALTVSSRVAEELQEHSCQVGYKIRFQDKTDKHTRIKFMTDGVLLAETRRDRLLRQYAILIIDEAHERSLNIDFLLGYLKNILNTRDDLKVIITSATIDTHTFSAHFNNAPIVTIPGKTYPVEVRYMPPEADEFGEFDNSVEAAASAVRQLHSKEPPGDILVFLPTERDIRSCCELIGKTVKGPDILPLFGRLHTADQKKIFHPSSKTKVVVATNVAETSITVPGIRYVVDTGLARISYYNYRAKTHSLPVKKISQASCDQRKGRCGRLGPGICIRLYSEEDYEQRDEYITPEIKRSNLAEVVLQMVSYRLGDPYSFPFLEPPATTAINEGYNQLLELGAITAKRHLTGIGKDMAALPIDPSISRIIIEARKNNCLKEILIIAPVLAIQDPRMRPADFEKQADEAHRHFHHDQSDFMVFVNIWNLYHRVKAKTSWSRLKKFCKSHFLSFQRMREWIDLHQQMLAILQKQSSFAINDEDASYEAVHRSLAIGFLRNIAMKKEKKLYTGPSAKEVMIFPGSGLFKSAPQWIIASSFMETNRLYALNVAAINPEWLEPLAGRLCKFSWTNPRYHKKTAQVIADEKVSLFGLPIVPSRRVNFGRTNERNRREARKIFIQSALIEGQLNTRYGFLTHNQELLAKWEDVENRLRTRDIVINETALYTFYDEKLPDTVHDRSSLNKFLKRKKPHDDLYIGEEDILERRPQGQELADFPPTFTIGDYTFDLDYTFDPAHEEDGVTIRIPRSLLQTLTPEIFEWLVPGLLMEKTTYLLRSLPKKLRKHLIPLSTTVERILDDIDVYKGSYFKALEKSIFKHFRINIKTSDWATEMPRHLKMRFWIYDLEGEKVASGRDFIELAALAEKAPVISTARAEDFLREQLKGWEQILVRDWQFEKLPSEVPLYAKNKEIAGFLYPAVTAVPDKAAVTIRFLDSRDDSVKQTRQGIRYLYRLQFSDQYKALKRYAKTALSGPSSLWLLNLYADKTRALEALMDFTTDNLFKNHEGSIPSRRQFDARIAEIRKNGFYSDGQLMVEAVLALMRKRHETISEINRHSELARISKTYSQERFEEYTALCNQTVPEDFLEHMPYASFADRERYLNGLIIRMKRAHIDLVKDRKKATALQPHISNLAQLKKRSDDVSPACHELAGHYEKMIDEMRISLFAPELKTAFPVSEKKLRALWQEIQREW